MCAVCVVGLIVVVCGCFCLLLVMTKKIKREPYAPPNCLAVNPNTTEACVSVGLLYPFVQRPLYVLNNQFDTCMLYADLNWPGDSSDLSLQVNKKKQPQIFFYYLFFFL